MNLLSLLLLICGPTDNVERSECSTVAAMWAAEVHHPTRSAEYLKWHQEQYPGLWGSSSSDIPYSLDTAPVAPLWSGNASLSAITPPDTGCAQGVLVAECDTTIARWFAKVHHPSAQSEYIDWHQNQYRGRWRSQAWPVRRFVVADSGNTDLYVSFGPGELPNIQAYGDSLWELVKVYDEDNTTFLNSGLFDRPRPTWPDGSLMEGFISFYAPRADTYWVTVDTTLAGPAPDSAFAGVPNFAVWTDSSAAGPDTVTFAAATPDQEALRVSAIQAVNSSPNAYQMWYDPIESVAFTDLEYQLYGRSYANGEVRWWLTAYHNAAFTGGSGYHTRVSYFGQDPDYQRSPTIGIVRTGSDSLRIRWAPDMYWGDLATADTMGIVGDTLWWDGMLNDSATTGGWGSYAYESQLRAREKIGWQIVTQAGDDNAEPTFAHMIQDADGTDPYIEWGHFGTVAPFDYDDDVQNGGDSLDIWYEAQVQQAINHIHTKFLGGRTSGGGAFWQNPRMNLTLYKDWDTGPKADAETHSMAEEYEVTYGIGTQFLRTAAAAPHDSLPTDFARKAFQIAEAVTWQFAYQGWLHSDGQDDGSIAGENHMWEWQFCHPGHGPTGLESTNRGLWYSRSGEHFNGRNLLLMYRLTMDPVIGEQAYDVAEKVLDWTTCQLTNNRPGTSCNGVGHDSGSILADEERAPANWIWLLGDWYAYTGDPDYGENLYEFTWRSILGQTPHDTPIVCRPFLFDPNGPTYCKKKAYMTNRHIRAARDAKDALLLQDYPLGANLDDDIQAWVDFIDLKGVTCGVTWPHGGVGVWDQHAWTNQGTCCEGGGCDYRACQDQYARTVDSPFGHWVGMASAIVGLSSVETNAAEIFHAGVYYSGGAASGLPWGGHYRMNASTFLMEGAQRFLRARYDAE